MVVEGKKHDLMACINLVSISKFCSSVKKLYIISTEKNLICKRVAEELGIQVEIFPPIEWAEKKVPPMRNGTFTTYYKFDLMQKIPLGCTLIYLDTDTFFVSDAKLDFIEKRLQYANSIGIKNKLLMVGSFRPMLEKIGYQQRSNPYLYFNAGVIFMEKNISFQVKDVVSHYRNYYADNSLVWHDQDLINTFFCDDIYPLPAIYNLSTGWISKKADKFFFMNRFEYKKLSSPIIVHASGDVLFSKRKFHPFKVEYLLLIEQLAKTYFLTIDEMKSLIELKKSIQPSMLINCYHSLRIFFGATNECSTVFYKNRLYGPHILRVIFQRLKKVD